LQVGSFSQQGAAGQQGVAGQQGLAHGAGQQGLAQQGAWQQGFAQQGAAGQHGLIQLGCWQQGAAQQGAAKLCKEHGQAAMLGRALNANTKNAPKVIKVFFIIEFSLFIQLNNFNNLLILGSSIKKNGARKERFLFMAIRTRFWIKLAVWVSIWFDEAQIHLCYFCSASVCCRFLLEEYIVLALHECIL
jgi:hypothetical protein